MPTGSVTSPPSAWTRRCRAVSGRGSTQRVEHSDRRCRSHTAPRRGRRPQQPGSDRLARPTAGGVALPHRVGHLGPVGPGTARCSTRCCPTRFRCTARARRRSRRGGRRHATWCRRRSVAAGRSGQVVTSIGLGAVGSFPADLPARHGVGNLTLVDRELLRPGDSASWSSASSGRRTEPDVGRRPDVREDPLRELRVARGLPAVVTLRPVSCWSRSASGRSSLGGERSVDG